jgi:hypothetical protein
MEVMDRTLPQANLQLVGSGQSAIQVFLGQTHRSWHAAAREQGGNGGG